MDWFLLHDYLRAFGDNDLLKRVVLILGGLANAAAIIGAIYALWRWWQGPSKGHKQAAKALRDEGEHRARLRHWKRADELYGLAIRLNPRAAEVYYLRGLLRAHVGDVNGAVADWKRCLSRHSTHVGARQQLMERHVEPVAEPAGWRMAAFGAAAAIVVLVLLGAWAMQNTDLLRSLVSLLSRVA